VTEESENRKVLTSCPAHARAIGEVRRGSKTPAAKGTD